MNKKETRLYNVLFPLWLLIFIPQAWLIILPGNFIIDSLVLIISMAVLKFTDRFQFYKKHIFMIFGFGMVSDIIGAGLMLLANFAGISGRGDELYITLPATIITAALIYIANYYVTFRKLEKPSRFKLALIFAIVTAPYTFLIPLSWIYG